MARGSYNKTISRLWTGKKIEMSSALHGFKANIRNQEMILSLEKVI